MKLIGLLDLTSDNVYLNHFKKLLHKPIFDENSSFNLHGLSIVVSKENATQQSRVLMDHHRLMIGNVFHKTSSTEMTPFDFANIKSNADLINHYWGNYLYFSFDNAAGTLGITRDPTGQLPLFYYKINKDAVIFSTHIDLIYQVLGIKPTFNLSYLSAYLLYSFITSEETAFENIYELPHGCELIVNRSGIRTKIVWDPIQYSLMRQEFNHCEERLLDTTSLVIKAMTRQSEAVCLDYSGGLDSTVLMYLLASLNTPNLKLYPINIFHPEVRSSDERMHANKVCNHLGIALTEFDNSSYLPFDPHEPLLESKPNWPTSNLMNIQAERAIGELISSNKQLLHMSGHGGDHIFLCPPPIESLTDNLLEKGYSSFNLKLKEICTMSRQPLFSIFNCMLKGFANYYFKNSYPHRSYAVDPHRRAPWYKKDLYTLAQNTTSHPFFNKTGSTKVLPGKFCQIDGIYDGLATIKNDLRHLTNSICYPFFSQPMIELALSIPTYDTYKNGYNRYLIRKAAADKFKTEHVWRKDKGETSGIMQRGLAKNADYIHSLCMDGVLANSGLFNKEMLLQNIKETACGLNTYLWPILSFITAELFIKEWSG